SRTRWHGLLLAVLGTVGGMATAYLLSRSKESAAREGSLLRPTEASLQMDFSGDEIITDRPYAFLGGSIPPSATLEIDGRAIELNAGRFAHKVDLPNPGTATVELVTKAPERPPFTLKVKVTRVANLAKEAERYQVDPALTYAVFEKSPETYG